MYHHSIKIKTPTNPLPGWFSFKRFTQTFIKLINFSKCYISKKIIPRFLDPLHFRLDHTITMHRFRCCPACLKIKYDQAFSPIQKVLHPEKFEINLDQLFHP